MEEIVKNLCRRRLWTTNLFVLCLLYQLILATLTGQDSVVTLNETQSEQTYMETLTKEMNLLKSKLITVKNLTEHNVGIFHKGSSRSTLNITQIERKMLQILNRVQELSNITDHGISDLGSVRERVNTLEKELEDLRRLYDNDGRVVRQDFGKFDSLLTNLTQAHNQLSDQLLTRINELENNLKYHIQPEITSFYKAMEAKNFSWAAVNFNKIIRKNEIVKFIKQSYEIVNNFECYMKLASQFVYCDKRQEIYSVIMDNYLLQENDSYADICHYVIILFALYKIKEKSLFENNNDLRTLVCNARHIFVSSSRKWNYLYRAIYQNNNLYASSGKTVIETLLPLLLQRNHHTAVDRIVIQKTYLNHTIYLVDYSNNEQTLYCEDNQIRLSRDNYVAPIDNC